MTQPNLAYCSRKKAGQTKIENNVLCEHCIELLLMMNYNFVEPVYVATVHFRSAAMTHWVMILSSAFKVSFLTVLMRRCLWRAQQVMWSSCSSRTQSGVVKSRYHVIPVVIPDLTCLSTEMADLDIATLPCLQ